MENVGLLLDEEEDLIAKGTSDYFEKGFEEIPLCDTLIPDKGIYLGLDISSESTGICYIEDGVRTTANITLEKELCKGCHEEVLKRRLLKKYLGELIGGKEIDLIVIEDVFVGDNPKTARLLYALNTAIDEMILDGVCSCKEFARVSNKVWKSWLMSVDKNGISKGLKDKEKIRVCMDILGIREEGEGFQDRLDASGMVYGYFLKGKDGYSTKKKVSEFDIEVRFEPDTGYLFYDVDEELPDENKEFIHIRSLSKKFIIEKLTENPDKIFISENLVVPGNVGLHFGLGICEDGGYLAFWVKRKKLRKYMS